MPDLSHRPTRYAVTAVVVAALMAGTATTMDVRIGADDELAAERERTSRLEQENRDLRERLGGDATAPGGPAGLTTPAAGPNCARYGTQEEAQAAFVADPVLLVSLDGDGDGAACEQLKSAASPGSATVAAPSGATPLGLARPLATGREPIAPAQEASPPMVPSLPDAPSKAEIVASGHHFGMATATTEEFDQLEFSLARDATMRGYYKGWDTPYDSARVASSWTRGEVPVMTWESRPLADTEDTTDYSLARIIDGSFDDYLTRYARDITALGLPLIIRFDHEMNGNWYRWSEFDNPYGNEKGEYVAAWRHVHDIFESVGANELVVWLWSPNRVDNLRRFPSIDGYFPGADYVDWVGMTGYHRPGDGTATFSATYDKTLAELRRVAPGVPIMLSEVGATETGRQKEGWVESLFPGLAANPDVTGFIWFNYAVTEGGVTNDWRIDSSPEVFEAFSTGLADSTYGRERGKRAVLVPRTSSEPPTLVATTPTTMATIPAPTTTSTTSTTTTSTTTTTVPWAPRSTTTTTASPRTEDR